MEFEPASEVVDWRIYKSLSINGVKRSLQGWRGYAQQQLQEGYGNAPLEEIMEFVVDWSNRKEWIETRTSGSTGRPKTIKIQKRQIEASSLRTLEALSLKSGDGALLCLANKFIGGKMMIARAIIGDLDLHIAENQSKPDLPVGTKIHFAALVPYQVSNILSDPEATERWKQVDKIIIGGGHVDQRLEEALSTWPNEVYETFGMTETISHIGLRRISGKTTREPFQLLDGIDISQDERGCLIIHSEHLPANPTITNDIIELCSARTFHWLGRADNLINSGGVKIIPETLEKIIKDHFNTRFFFAGLPDEQLGEKVTLIIESQPLSADDEALLMKDLRSALSKFEVPRKIVFLDSFEETENGKINRKKTIKKIAQIPES